MKSDTQRKKKILILALLAGEIMMRAGAEIYRVEDTIIRICKACKVDFIECFAMPSGLYLSIDSRDNKEDTPTLLKRIHQVSIDLNKISLVNDFSREFVLTDLSISDGFEKLREINNLKEFPLWLKSIGAFLIGTFISTLFGASLFEMPIAGITSGVSFLIVNMIHNIIATPFLKALLGSALIAFLCIGATVIFPTLSPHPMIIGALTVFLPGVAITNAARDILSGDMLSGLARGTEAVTVGIGLAIGVGGVFQLISVLNYNFPDKSPYAYPLPVYLIFGLLASLGFCLLFNATKKLMPLIIIMGGLSTLFYEVLLYTGYGVVATCFMASVFVGIISEFCSRAGKEATTIFIIPCILPLVPGAPMYEMMLSLIKYDLDKAFNNGLITIFCAGSIAIALVLTATITRAFMLLLNKIIGAIKSRTTKI